MKHDVPLFLKGDVLVRREPHTAPGGKTFTLPTDQITLREDTTPAEAARVRTPAEGTLLVSVEYIDYPEKIGGRWIVPVKHGQMDNAYILRHYALKGGQRGLF